MSDKSVLKTAVLVSGGGTNLQALIDYQAAQGDSCPYKIVCVISLGYGETQGSVHKSKAVEKLCDIPENEQPDWFKEGLEAAILAPTAINQQKFHVSLKDGEPVIKAKSGPMTKIDLGIVKYNFEAASGHKVK